jgi:long-subunit acyl-CoA synthetase (AMP-forming)
MFSYTSGTTGEPKGAKVSHSCIVANTSFWDFSKVDWTQDDVVISYLPLPHDYEQSTLIKSFAIGF